MPARKKTSPPTLRNDLDKRIAYVDKTFPVNVTAATMLAAMNALGLEHGRLEGADVRDFDMMLAMMTKAANVFGADDYRNYVTDDMLEKQLAMDADDFRDAKLIFERLRARYIGDKDTIIDPYLPWAASQLNKASKQARRALKKARASGGNFADPDAVERYDDARIEYKNIRAGLSNTLGMIARWADSESIDINRYDLRQAAEAAEIWLEDNPLPAEPGEVIYQFDDGWSIHRLMTDQQLEDEGNTLGHCVGDYCDVVDSGDVIIWSLRDAKSRPRVTIEWDPESKYIRQFKAKGNSMPTKAQAERFWCFVQDVIYKQPDLLGSATLYDNIEPAYAYGEAGYDMDVVDGKFRDNGGTTRFMRVTDTFKVFPTGREVESIWDAVFFKVDAQDSPNVWTVDSFGHEIFPSDDDGEPMFPRQAQYGTDEEIVNSPVPLMSLQAINPPLEYWREALDFGDGGPGYGDEFVATAEWRGIDFSKASCQGQVTAANPRRKTRRKLPKVKKRELMRELTRAHAHQVQGGPRERTKLNPQMARLKRKLMR